MYHLSVCLEQSKTINCWYKLCIHMYPHCLFHTILKMYIYTLKNRHTDWFTTYIVLNISNAFKWHVTDSVSYYFCLSWPTASKNMNVSSFATCISFCFQFIFLSGNLNYCMVPFKWMILITLQTSSVISMHMFLHIKLIVRTIKRWSWQIEFSGT